MTARKVLPLAQLKQAAARLVAVGCPPTPVLRSEWIDYAIGCACHFKAEHLQRTGSFKYRGATNAVGALDDATVSKGVVAHSSGNHGAAVAAAATARGIPCTVVVPRTTPEAKVANMRRHGARVVLCEPTQGARTATSAAEAERMGGAAFVHPYDDEMVIAGQGTIGLELMEQVPEVRPLGDGNATGGNGNLQPSCPCVDAHLATHVCTRTHVSTLLTRGTDASALGMLCPVAMAVGRGGGSCERRRLDLWDRSSGEGD